MRGCLLYDGGLPRGVQGRERLCEYMIGVPAAPSVLCCAVAHAPHDSPPPMPTRREEAEAREAASITGTPAAADWDVVNANLREENKPKNACHLRELLQQ